MYHLVFVNVAFRVVGASTASAEWHNEYVCSIYMPVLSLLMDGSSPEFSSLQSAHKNSSTITSYSISSITTMQFQSYFAVMAAVFLGLAVASPVVQGAGAVEARVCFPQAVSFTNLLPR